MPRVPFSASAEMSVDGYRCDRPNPAMPTLAPSSMSATASAADAITLLNGSSCLRLGVLDDPVGEHGRDLGVVLFEHHRVPVAVNAHVVQAHLGHVRAALT